MRVDRKINELTLTPNQKAFMEGWYNMVHESSLDSHRVRCMNARNVLRETLALSSRNLPKIEQDQAAVALEALGILRSDPVLGLPPLAELSDQVIAQIERLASAKDFGQDDRNLLHYYGRDLQELLKSKYATVLASKLSNLLFDQGVPQGAQETLSAIHATTACLLSNAIDEGQSLERLFSIYRRVLCYAPEGVAYSFAEAFQRAVQLLSLPEQEFRIVFAVEGFTKANELPDAIGSVKVYRADPLPLAAGSNAQVRKFALQGLGKVFFELKIIAKDHRSAGVAGFRRVSALLDLIRFELEQSHTTIFDEFLAEIAGASPRIYRLPSRMPNPRRNLSADQFGKFMTAIGAVLESKNLSEEGADRMKSAFRLYRLGLDADTAEQKLVSWWTAMEYLVRGEGRQGGIAQAVENYVTPCLCLDYIAKHLESYRQVLGFLQVKHEGVNPAVVVDYRAITLRRMFESQSIVGVQQTTLEAVAEYPLLRQKLSQFYQMTSTPQQVLASLKEHEQRVRWQVNRLWRTRCDIVHSAGVTVGAQLLGASLEFYLKSCLASLLEMLIRNPRISGPKEFFERKEHAYALLKRELQVGKTAVLIEHLSEKGW
jgi:hypothetical protein